MHCPICHVTDTKVVDSRLMPEGLSVRRRRKCEGCDNRFTTYEKIQIQMPAVLKHDGRRESYNRDKILSGLKKASQKRPVSTEDLEKLMEKIERHMLEHYPKEVPSNVVGELTMKELLHLDPVAYTRFASFYWDYKDIEGFVSSLLKNLTASKGVEREQLQQ
ncbi:transcriptional regulator NrdR [Halobacteriovorax sp. JY17]|uniref:transcriptional regulator NrdR n=1 Tax=Halobacteriovorax sp. JY17 TaxID=2014617 RepID=UPI000C63014E|nr:transcriptional regulator NrdR [Halobacteriovorax sp. JY17]PIK16446.1 MAG: transcriptional regulator NrdR [Halobacteriovorax sp. JY17]